MPPIPEQLEALRQDVSALHERLDSMTRRQDEFVERHVEITTAVVDLLDDVRAVLKAHAEDEEHSGDQYRERTAESRERIANRVSRLRELTAEPPREHGGT